MMRDTLENWQSEFLQLIWQVGGLAFLLYVGSPQSKEGDDRVEAKIDEILRRVAPSEAERSSPRSTTNMPAGDTDPRHVRQTGMRKPRSAGRHAAASATSGRGSPAAIRRRNPPAPDFVSYESGS